MSIEIIDATIEHARDIADFQVAMAMETEDKPLELPIVERAVRRVFEDPGKGFYLVAVRDDEQRTVAGSLLVTMEWSDWRDSFMWYIQSVYVRPEFRGQGAFKKLYQNVISRARENDVMFVRLYVETENERAQQIYESLGMKRMPYFMYDVRVT